MNFSIVPLYYENKAKIYTIQVEGAELSEYKQFVFENMNARKEAVRVLDVTLKNMAHRRGFIDEFFIRESPQDFNVFKVTETDDLRLYCIRYSGIASKEIKITDNGFEGDLNFKDL